MANVCSLCRRKDRADVDAAIMAGTPLRTVSEHFGTSPQTLLRHREHVPRGLALAARAAEESTAEDLAGKVRRLESDSRRLQALAERQGDVRAALAAIKLLCELVGLWERAAAAAREEAQRRPATPKPCLSDAELVGAIETVVRRAAARKETSDVVRPN